MLNETAFNSDWRRVAEKILQFAAQSGTSEDYSNMRATCKISSPFMTRCISVSGYGQRVCARVKSAYLKPVSVGRPVTLKVCECSSWLTSGAARSLLNCITLTKTTRQKKIKKNLQLHF